MNRTLVRVNARDPISEAGIVSQLRQRPEVRIVAKGEPMTPEVVVVVADTLDDETLTTLRFLQRHGDSKTVLVATQIGDGDLVRAAESGVVGLIRRAEARSEHLVAAIRAAAAGNGTVPPDLLGRLLDEVGRLQRTVLDPRGIPFCGLAAREVEVLRLVSEGWDTSQIALKLSYSERTVKNVLHDVTTRLQLRNRSHAVAYAMREGLI